jgi:hypothetical protein
VKSQNYFAEQQIALFVLSKNVETAYSELAQ